MKKTIRIVFAVAAAIAAGGSAMAASTNLPSPSTVAVMVDTNGVLVAPTNFLDANGIAGTGDIATVEGWVNAVSGRVDVIEGLTNDWNQAVTDAADWTNWWAGHGDAWAALTNDQAAYNSYTQGWVTASEWVNAYSSQVWYAIGRTSVWDQAAEDASAATNHIADTLADGAHGGEQQTWADVLAKGATADRAVDMGGFALTNAPTWWYSTQGRMYYSGGVFYWYDEVNRIVARIYTNARLFFDDYGEQALDFGVYGRTLNKSASWGTKWSTDGDATTGPELLNYRTGTNLIKTLAWTAENDGPGSGLDADTLDGVDGSGYTTPADWDTLSKINSATTDTDAVGTNQVGSLVQRWDADLDMLSLNDGGSLTNIPADNLVQGTDVVVWYFGTLGPTQIVYFTKNGTNYWQKYAE